MWSLQIFVPDTTAELLWDVQTFEVICWSKTEILQAISAIEFELWLKNH